MHILYPTFISPPFSSPGSVRLAQTVRDLASLGARITIVTGSLDDYLHGFPQESYLDDGLVRIIPPEVKVIRTNAVRPGRTASFLKRVRLERLRDLANIPDPFVFWNKIAVSTCLAICDNMNVDCIYTSSNPLSSHLIGLELKRITNIPWLAEFRDPWTTNEFRTWQSKFHYKIEKRLEKRVLKEATRVTCVTRGLKRSINNAFPESRKRKIDVIHNGFDIEKSSTEKIKGAHFLGAEFVIAYVGSMYRLAPDRNKLSYTQKIGALINNVGKFDLAHVNMLGRSPWYLFKALSKVLHDNPEWVGKIKVVIAGRLPRLDGLDGPIAGTKIVEGFNLENTVVFLGPLSRDNALSLMESADVLFLTQLYSMDNTECPGVPLKTYEYMAMNKPILAALPPGDAREFVTHSGLGFVVDTSDYNELSTRIVDLFKRKKHGDFSVFPNHEFIQQFRSDILSKQKHNIFCEMIDNFHF